MALAGFCVRHTAVAVVVLALTTVPFGGFPRVVMTIVLHSASSRSLMWLVK